MVPGTATSGGLKMPPVTPSIRWLYGFGSAAYGVKDNGFSFFLMIFYSQVLGLPATLAGLAIMIALIFDAISDPLVGYWSDNTHSRYGRRHPFMYISALPVSVSYFFLWNPPLESLSEFGLFMYLTAMAILVRFFITLYEIPSTSIVAELTEDYDERTRLLGYRYMFGWYGGLSMAVLAWGVFMADSPDYPNGVLNPDAYYAYSLTGSIIIFLSIVGSSIALHKYIPYLQPARQRKNFSLFQIPGEIKTTLGNRNFLALFMAGLFAAVGAGVATNFDAYMTNYFWGFNSSDIRWINVALFGSAATAAIVTPILTRKYDKKISCMGVYATSIFFGAAPVILRLMGWFPDNDHPWMLTIIITHAAMNVTLIVMFGIIQSSMLADIVEHSQMKTGRREEGLFFAARTFAAKATSGLGTLFAGIALDLISFPRGASPGEVPDDVIFNLGLVYGPMLMVFYLLALGAISFYQITRTGHNDRVVVLEERSQES